MKAIFLVIVGAVLGISGMLIFQSKQQANESAKQVAQAVPAQEKDVQSELKDIKGIACNLERVYEVEDPYGYSDKFKYVAKRDMCIKLEGEVDRARRLIGEGKAKMLSVTTMSFPSVQDELSIEKMKLSVEKMNQINELINKQRIDKIEEESTKLAGNPDFQEKCKKFRPTCEFSVENAAWVKVKEKELEDFKKENLVTCSGEVKVSSKGIFVEAPQLGFSKVSSTGIAFINDQPYRLMVATEK